jgi:curved DNA-binding protein CbpA
VPKRDPHDILGVPRGASQATIKAAWRKLAREHHPDVAGADAVAARSATRRMAEINRAYEQLRIGTPGAAGRDPAESTASRRTTWPPRPRPTRPVTARLDLSGTFRPRNTTSARASTLPGHTPLRGERLDREPPRASQPNGPLDRGMDPNFRPAPVPSVEAASATRIEFGKFHGHSLGEIAAFEPSYIDWLSRTISHDPELVGAARSLRAELDRRGVIRRLRPVPSR